MFDNYICALDIDSGKLASCVARIKKGEIMQIFFATALAKGVKFGTIVDPIELTNSVSNILKDLKSKSGINIKYIYTNLSGQVIKSKHSNAIIPLAERGNKVITRFDIQEVIEQARILGSSLEEEIIHMIPSSYTVDANTDISNPLGLYGHRLEVDLYLICAKLTSVHSLTHLINQAGYEVKDLFFSGIATAEAILNSELKTGVTVLCDIGSDTTELLLFIDGVLKNIEILPIGSDNLTLRLSEELNLPFELAEEIKRSHAFVGDSSFVREDKEVLVKKNNTYKPIKQKLVCEIVTSCIQSICQSLKESVDKMISLGKVNNFIVIGKLLLLDGALEALENYLGVPIKLARLNSPKIYPFVNKDENLSGQKYLEFVTAIGIICQALHKEDVYSPGVLYPSRNIFARTISRVKELYQEYF